MFSCTPTTASSSARWCRRIPSAAARRTRISSTSRLINHGDYPFFASGTKGELYLRAGTKLPWRNDDLQSFTPLRFMPPELMGYEGRALVVDPDVFAVGDVWELLSRDMQGKAIMCRVHGGVKRTVRGTYASSVMLLDCAKLKHWRTEAQFDALFAFTRDYRTWIGPGLRGPGDHRRASSRLERFRPSRAGDAG